MNHLIPTRYKENLPKDISYPIGAELISQILFGIPQYNDINLSFFFWGGAEYQRILEADILYFFEASYSKSDKSVSNTKKREETEWVKPKWEIYVSPVPSKIWRAVKEVCINEGLPMVKEWFIQDRPDNWYYGRKKIKLSYKVSEKVLNIVAA